MEQLRITLESESRTEDVAAALGRVLERGDAVLLIGGLGAGKTAFAKGVASGLGFCGNVTSPTFNIVSIYEGGRIPMAHFDLYRLEDPLELEDIDFYASVDDSSGQASLIEWADLFPDEMPDDALSIRIQREGDDASCTRIMEVAPTGPRSSRTLDLWKAELGLA